MLCDYVWLCAYWLFELTIGYLFAFALNVFTLLVLIIIFLCQKSRNAKKIENQKVWSTLLSFVSKHVLPCTFVLMALCIYEHSLFPIHLYPCGRTLDIYVTVVNRSLNLSWMISEWFCWSWNMHRLVPIYLPTHLFYCFCLKELSNVNLKMKRDNELQKPIPHTSIWLRKRESDLKIKSMMPKKPKACSSIEMSKILGINLRMRCYDSKRSNVMKNMEPNEKLQSYVIKLRGRSYMHIFIIEMGHII